MNALTAVGPDAVARREKQAAADDLDMSIGPDCRLKGRDPPRSGRVPHDGTMLRLTAPSRQHR